jgi:predicted O-methyltransferase YrrM
MQAHSLSQYANDLLGAEDPLLHQFRDEAAAAGLPSIQVPPELGRLLAALVTATGATRVLEIGTLFGYSAILMARALPADGRLITLEVNPTHARLAERNIERAGLADRVTVRQGNALDSLAALDGQDFDLVFIDADKPTYPEYLEWATKLTHPRSVIVADNVWREGIVIDPGDDEAGNALARFNRDLAANPTLLTTFFPTRDGNDAAAISVVRGG